MKYEHTPLTDAELEKFAAYQMATDDWLWLRIVADLRLARRLLRLNTWCPACQRPRYDDRGHAEGCEIGRYLDAAEGKEREHAG